MNFSEYSSEVFNKIASLNKANGALHEKGGFDTIDNVLRPLFFNHNLADLFGVGLVHRHSNIESGKAMVECNNVSGPWELGSLSKHGGSIVPLSWTMVEGTIYPYEYVFTNHNQTVPVSVEDCSAFAQAFFEAVQKLGLEQVIGLRRRPANEGLEVTEGAMNIMFPINEVPEHLLHQGTTDTMWFFDPKMPFKTYRCTCTNTGSATNPNHNHIDQR